MSIARNNTRRQIGFLGALAFCAMLLMANAASALAGPIWRVDSLATTTAAPGETVRYLVQATNTGDAPADGTVDPMIFTATLSPGLEVVSVLPVPLFTPSWSCPPPGGESITCVDSADSLEARGWAFFWVDVSVEADSGLLTSKFEISGGGAPPASSVDPITVTPDLPAFGIDAFDEQMLADASGTPFSQAGGHPDTVETSIDFNTIPNPEPMKGTPWPAEPVKDVIVDLPAGSLGDPSGLAQCSFPDLANGIATIARPLCPRGSQVGTILVRLSKTTSLGPFGIAPAATTLGPVPVFNMVPPPNAPARLGFNVANTIVTIEAQLRSDGDYGLAASSSNVPEGLNVAGTKLTVWGVPADPVHDPQRACPGEQAPWENGPSCASQSAPKPFWRAPTSCEEEASGLASTLSTDSWFDPGDFDRRTIHSHLPNGYPYPESEWGDPQGPTGCSEVKFEPTLEATPTTEAADSPSGLDLHLRVPQDCWSEVESICQSDLRDAEVSLPRGMALNPSAASGLGSCTSSQVGLTTPAGSSPIRFDTQPANCPDSAKIGTVEIVSPLLGRHDPETGEPITDADGKVVPEPLNGSVYLAQQQQNPFGSMLAMYLVAEGSGVVVKQAGEIKVGPGGQLTTVFRDAPQVPFSDLHLELFGGPRGPLRTPPTCGTYTTEATLTPWSGNPASVIGSAFEITNCGSGGFDPKLSAGTENPLAATYSPFSLRLTREDGTEELAGLKLDIPKGLLANLKGIPYCPDATLAAISGALGTGAAQVAQPSCPAASQVGTLTAGAGAGPTPFYSTTGKAYWAGPYKGAPVSLAVVVPAVAGPFDLGNVVVRNGLQVNPETAQITALADPFPTALHGIPLDLRDVRVQLTRPNYTLNPTSCDPMSFEADIVGAQGAVAHRSQRFQVAGCDRLRFKPKLSLRLKGATKRGGHPALRAVLTMPPGGANIAAASVTLPHSEFLAQDHIRTICTRVQYAADQCPKGSVYGYARAYSPILDNYLQGPVYLRSSSHPLPDLVAHLGGQIEIDVVGRIDSVKGGIRSTFKGLPDAPVSKFVLEMPGGKKSLLENSVNICRGEHRAAALFDAQNGKIRDLRPVLKPNCGGKSGKRYR